MQAKEFFQRIYIAESKLHGIRERQQHYQQMGMTLAGMSETHVRSTENRSRVEMAALGLVDLSAELEKEAEAYLELIKQAEYVLSNMPTPRYRELLTMRYLQGMSWRAIRERTGITEADVIFKRHGRALLEAQKLLDAM